MTTLQQLTSSQSSPEVPINENMETLSAAGIYGKRQPTSSGLSWGHYGGFYNGNTVADDVLTLDDNADNYVVVNRATGIVTSSTTDTNSVDPDYAKLYKVTTAGGVVSATLDQRWDANGLFFSTGGGGGGGSGTVTHTGGALTSNGVVYGAGADDVAVCPGITVDGVSELTLGEEEISWGAIYFFSGDNIGYIRLTIPSGQELGNEQLILPNKSGTLAITTDIINTMMPNSLDTDYTTANGSQGGVMIHIGTDANPRTFTIEANSVVAYDVGTQLTFVNQNGAGTLTIAITDDTMRLAGAGTTGSRTLAANGIARALKIDTTEWIIDGTGLS
jgi:hypothetical protein